MSSLARRVPVGLLGEGSMTSLHLCFLIAATTAGMSTSKLSLRATCVWFEREERGSKRHPCAMEIKKGRYAVVQKHTLRGICARHVLTGSGGRGCACGDEAGTS